MKPFNLNLKAFGWALALLPVGCAHGPASASPEAEAAARSSPPAVSAAAAARQDDTRPVPVADHHTHLFTQSVIARIVRPPLPAVELSQDLARLLRDRAARWNDQSALAELYTANSVVLASRGLSPNWIRGPDAVASYVSGLFARPYYLTPVSYEVRGSAGYIAGYFTRGEGAAARHFGHVLLSLDRGSDGVWRIAAETPTFPGPRVPESAMADALVAQLDAAGIQRAQVLSTAYWFGSAQGRSPEDEYARVRAENDYVAQQVARFPTRLVGFCSVNPLKQYALEELERCAHDPRLTGLKLHFGDSGVNVRNPEHVEQLRRVFRAANDYRVPIVVHLMTADPSYGQAHSEIFLSQIVPAAPEVPIQIAHMAGAGPDYNSDEAFGIFAEAVAAGDPRTKNLYVDVATVVTAYQSAETLALIARRLRQFGVQRVLYGSDTPASPEYTPELGWLYFRRLPLTEHEFTTIAGNLPPHLR